MKKSKNLIAFSVLALSAMLTLLVVVYRSDIPYQTLFKESTTHQVEASKLFNTNEKSLIEQSQLVYQVNTKNKYNQEIRENMAYALEYAKIDFSQIDINDVSKIKNPSNTVLTFSQRILEKDEVAMIEEFLNKGGGVIFLQKLGELNEHPTLRKILNIEEVGGEDISSGLQFIENIFNGYEDVSEDDSDAFIYSVQEVELNKKARVLLKTDDIPLAWKSNYKKGKVIYWNSASTMDKVKRGLLIQTVRMLLPTFVSAQANVQVMHIDDFPAPIPEEKTNVLDGKTVQDISDFYQNNWWKDMKRIAAQYNLKYTGAIIGTYKNDVNNFDDIYTTMKNTLLVYGRDLLNKESELSVHGYNHEPLVLKEHPIEKSLGYTPWKNDSDMIKGLTTLKSTLDRIFANTKITTYVPPSNILSENGVNSLKKVFPQLDTIAALYYGDQEGSVYITEFEKHHKYNDILLFPRTTSGFEFTKFNQYKIADVVSNFGVLSHFIHPDDAFDLKRSNGLTWQEMAKNYEEMHAFIHENYPMMKSYTQNDATKIINQYLKGDIDVVTEGNDITIYQHNMPQSSSYLVYVESGKELKAVSKDVEIIKQSETLYNVSSPIGTIELEVKGVK